MFEDETVSPKPRALEDMSLEELAKRIDLLKDEIHRCEQEIEKKQAVKAAADDIFG